MAHKCAKLMLQYAEDAAKISKPWVLWESKLVYEDKWTVLTSHPSWDYNRYDYRRIKLTPHPHAKLMMQYALDAALVDTPHELYEYNPPLYMDWKPLTFQPGWKEDVNYRRKPNLAVNNLLSYGQKYYIPDIHALALFKVETWADSEKDLLYLNRGLVYMSREAAIDKAKILLERV